jgi:hypothetical protein
MSLQRTHTRWYLELLRRASQHTDNLGECRQAAALALAIQPLPGPGDLEPAPVSRPNPEIQAHFHIFDDAMREVLAELPDLEVLRRYKAQFLQGWGPARVDITPSPFIRDLPLQGTGAGSTQPPGPDGKLVQPGKSKTRTARKAGKRGKGKRSLPKGLRLRWHPRHVAVTPSILIKG